MTRRTNATIAGVTYLAYIALAYPASMLLGRAYRGDDVATRLASVAAHAGEIHLAAVLNLLSGFCAIVLGVTLYAITRVEDPDIAKLGLLCRAAEGTLGGLSIQRSLGLLWLATASGPNAAGPVGAPLVAAYLWGGQSWTAIASTFFAVGSTAFCWLLLRGRMLPSILAWTGVIGSALLVIGIPLQIAGVLHSPITDVMWIPIAAFEILGAFWLIIRGVNEPRTHAAPIEASAHTH